MSHYGHAELTTIVRHIMKNQSAWIWRAQRDRTGKITTSVATDAACYRVEKKFNPDLMADLPRGIFNRLVEAGASDWKGNWFHRTDEGILTSNEGSLVVLRVPTLCTIDEWERITEGDIPKKFMNF